MVFIDNEIVNLTKSRFQRNSMIKAPDANREYNLVFIPKMCYILTMN